MKILVSAYSCEPGKPSEPAVGWYTVNEIAKYHKVWVLTRESNRQRIEESLSISPNENLTFAYFDFPKWFRLWKRGGRGVQLYYYLWQLGAYFTATKLHKKENFDVAQHSTFVNYWKPSFLSFMNIPYVWGPVGGGDATPLRFLMSLSTKGKLFEITRELARWLGEHDPLVRRTARRSRIALATTEETANRMKVLGAKSVFLLSQVALSDTELKEFSQDAKQLQDPIKFISVGRLLSLKGFEFGLRAFKKSGLDRAEYWIIGNGPERMRLKNLAEKLGISSQVKFLGEISRKETLRAISQCHVLIHPSLHDSGGYVCLEAMISGLPVICLDLGGPPMQITRENGFSLPAITPDQVVQDLAKKMVLIVSNPELYNKMSIAAISRVNEFYSWTTKGQIINNYLESLLSEIELS